MKNYFLYTLIIFLPFIGYSQNGTLDATNGVTVGDNTTITTDGTIRYDGTDFLGLKSGTWESLTSSSGGSSPWSNSSSGIFYNSGNVGLGLINPASILDINGDFILRGSPRRIDFRAIGSTGAGASITFNGTDLFMGPVLTGADFYMQADDNLYFRTKLGSNPYTVRMIVSENGNVGIGTVSPAEKLDVVGAINLGNTITNNAGTIRYNTSGDFEGYDGTSWKSLTSGGGGSIWTQNGSTINYEQALITHINSSGLFNSRITLREVDSTNPFNPIKFKAVLDGEDGTLLLSNLSNIFLDADMGQSYIEGGLHLGYEPISPNIQSGDLFMTGQLKIKTSGTKEFIVLNPNEGTGVGAQMIMNNFSGNDAIEMEAEWNANQGASLDLRGYHPGSGNNFQSKIRMLANGQQNQGGEIQLRSYSGQSGVLIEGDENTDSGGQITVYDGSGIPSIVLDGQSNGNGTLQIGSQSVPSGYMVAVDGKAIFEEVQVELSASWPDYVFETEYNLMSLQDVEKYINVHGHLPNIPSANKVESEGIALGEMQRLMMEKIEELTLHMIRLEKENKDLIAELKNMSNEK